MVAKVLFARIASRRTRRMTSNIDIETQIDRIAAWRSDGSPMSFAAVNGPVTGSFQLLRQQLIVGLLTLNIPD